MNEETKYVDEDYLLSHGFVRYSEGDENNPYEIPFQNEEDLHFVEKEFDRNMFAIILSESDYDGNPMDHQIWVQNNAGCGFTLIPERWSGLPVKFFESIYYGIRGEYPKQIQ